MKYRAKDLTETKRIAADFVATLRPVADRARVVGLYGDLGAGKTSFTQGVAEALGITISLVSPTFVIEKIYELTNRPFTHLIHIDAYRLEQPQELLHLGWEEICADPKNLIFIEWPERVAPIMPAHTAIHFTALPVEGERDIEIDESI